MSKCEICGGSGYHKLSCGNNTARVAIPMDIVIEEQEKKYLNGIRDQIEKLTPSDYEVMPEETVCVFNAFLPTLKGKADENVRLMKQRRCKNHVWRKHYLNGGKVCQVCGKAKEIPTRNKDVEE
jgi:hypothetical protein